MATTEADRFSGSPRLLRGGAAAGLIGLVAWVTCLGLDGRRALFALLTSYAWLASTLLGALAFLMILHAARAEWPVTVRRLLEGIVAAVPVLTLLFVPLAFGMGRVWPWADRAHHAALSGVLAHHGAWWSPGFFVARGALYLGLWWVLAALLRRWSLAQDADGALHWTQRSERLSAGGLVALAFTLTFAAFDWLMSLTPAWFSSLFGLYVFAGGFVAALALFTLVVTRAHGLTGMAQVIAPGHYLSLGKLLFAQVIFWGYLAFSQYFIVWIAHVPREASWWAPRTTGWGDWSLVLALVHFAVPFALLLSRDLKRTPRGLSLVSGWLLVAHYLDVYWLVMPTLTPERPRPHVADLAALLFVGGTALVVGVMRARGLPLVARRAPGWTVSSRYEGT
jgi:hypothetical protein